MIIDLTHEIRTGMRTFPGDPGVTISEALTHEADYCHVDRMYLGSHSGTHIDAPFHFIKDGKRITDYDMNKFCGKGIVMDFSDKRADEPITAEDVLKYKESVKNGHFAVVKTGWYSKFDSDEYLHHPYITGEAAEILVNMGISIVAVDFLNVDPTTWECWEAHPVFLSEEVLIVENLSNTGELEDGQEYDFWFAPLKIKASDGAPIRAFTVKK